MSDPFKEWLSLAWYLHILPRSDEVLDVCQDELKREIEREKRVTPQSFRNPARAMGWPEDESTLAGLASMVNRLADDYGVPASVCAFPDNEIARIAGEHGVPAGDLRFVLQQLAAKLSSDVIDPRQIDTQEAKCAVSALDRLIATTIPLPGERRMLEIMLRRAKKAAETRSNPKPMEFYADFALPQLIHLWKKEFGQRPTVFRNSQGDLNAFGEFAYEAIALVERQVRGKCYISRTTLANLGGKPQSLPPVMDD